MQSLIIGGLFGAAAGMVIALANSSANPDNFAPQYTFFAYTVLLLGGAARVFGPVVGAVIFWGSLVFPDAFLKAARSEERRVGEACVSTCRSRWSPYH